MTTFQPDNSAFIIGLVNHPDLQPAQFPPLVEALVGFLLEIKRRLPDTDIRVMLDANNDASLAIARGMLAQEISVDAMVIAATAGHAAGSAVDPWEDLLSHPLVHRIEVAAEQSCNPHQPMNPVLADILIRRASLLLACWDGHSSSLPNDTADQVYRFLGVAGDQGESGNRIEVSPVADDLEVAARLVVWVPVRRGAHDASDGVGQPCYLVFAGDSVLEVQHSMPPSFERRLADLNEYNAEFERVVADARLMRGESLLDNNPANMALSDAADLENIDAGPSDYTRYGFRVPAVVVSPYARPGYVCTTTFDHTSILKLIEQKWNLAPLTRRDATAASPLDALDLDSEPAFATPPPLPAPRLAWGSWASRVAPPGGPAHTSAVRENRE